MNRPLNRPSVLRWSVLLVQCGLGVFLLWWLAAQSNIDGRQVAQRFTQASFLHLTAGVLCYLIAMGLAALRYYLFLPTSTAIHYLVGTALLQNALLTFVPARIGELSYPLLLRRDYGIPIASSSAVIVVVRLVDLSVILAVSLIGSRKLGIDVHWSGTIFVVVLACLAIVTLLVRHTKAPALLQTVVSALTPLRRPANVAILISLSVAIFTLTTIQSAFILEAMAFTVLIPDLALLNALGLLAALLPIHPPGGWGTIDSIQVAILAGLGYSPGISTPALLAAHSFYTLLILIGGIAGWLVRARSRRSLKTFS